MRFKNIRKVPSKVGLVLTKPPPIKKLRLKIKHPAVSTSIHAEHQSSDTTTYKRHVEYMKKHALQANRMDLPLRLMEETRNLRISWIRESKPQVPAILDEFPYLRNSKIVSNFYAYK